MYYSLRRASNHKLRTSRRRAPQQPPPRLEALEQRLAPATITVTTGFDDAVANDGSVSLREAITALNNGSTGGDNEHHQPRSRDVRR
jgi:CSLREA domain-containing protein